MRYRDAAHVDMGSFYARRPELGKMYRLLGYAGIAGVWWHQHNPDMLQWLLVVLIVLWFMAWFRIVGALWRSSAVAACFLCAVLITAHRLQLTGHAP